MFEMFNRYPVLERCIVNLKGGKAFRGIVWERRGRYLVLRQAEVLKPGGEAVRVDGQVAVLEADVEFLQVIGG